MPMHEVPQMTFELLKDCADLVDSIASKYRTKTDLPPLSGMNVAHNKLVQCCELLDYYYSLCWGINPRVKPYILGISDRKSTDQNSERVSSIQTSTFISIMSSLEFSAKNAVKLVNSPISFQENDRLYMGKIMKKSSECGLISNEDFKLWDFSTELRNCMVHNNGIADKRMQVVLENHWLIEMVPNSMTQSSPRKNILLIKSILFAYSRWCVSILSHQKHIV